MTCSSLDCIKINCVLELVELLGGGAIYSLYISILMPRSVLVNLYYTLVQSVVCQNIIIWGASPLTVIQPLKVKINNILRIILKVKRVNYIPNMSTSIMYKELKILNLNDLYKFNILKFIHRTFHNDNRHLIDTYFSDL